MQQNYSQKIEMQIPQENTYIGTNIIQRQDTNLNLFLKTHFKFPSENLNELNDFINEDAEMEKIIYNLPEIISTELEYKQLSLDFMKETDPNEKILEIVIYSSLDEETLLQKEDLISEEIIDKYPKTINEYILLVEHYVE